MNRDIMDIACVGGNGGFSIVDRAGLYACFNQQASSSITAISLQACWAFQCLGQFG